MMSTGQDSGGPEDSQKESNTANERDNSQYQQLVKVLKQVIVTEGTDPQSNYNWCIGRHGKRVLVVTAAIQRLAAELMSHFDEFSNRFFWGVSVSVVRDVFIQAMKKETLPGFLLYIYLQGVNDPLERFLKCKARDYCSTLSVDVDLDCDTAKSSTVPNCFGDGDDASADSQLMETLKKDKEMCNMINKLNAENVKKWGESTNTALIRLSTGITGMNEALNNLNEARVNIANAESKHNTIIPGVQRRGEEDNVVPVDLRGWLTTPNDQFKEIAEKSSHVNSLVGMLHRHVSYFRYLGSTHISLLEEASHIRYDAVKLQRKKKITETQIEELKGTVELLKQNIDGKDELLNAIKKTDFCLGLWDHSPTKQGKQRVDECRTCALGHICVSSEGIPRHIDMLKSRNCAFCIAKNPAALPGQLGECVKYDVKNKTPLDGWCIACKDDKASIPVSGLCRPRIENCESQVLVLGKDGTKEDKCNKCNSKTYGIGANIQVVENKGVVFNRKISGPFDVCVKSTSISQNCHHFFSLDGDCAGCLGGDKTLVVANTDSTSWRAVNPPKTKVYKNELQCLTNQHQKCIQFKKGVTGEINVCTLCEANMVLLNGECISRSGIKFTDDNCIEIHEDSSTQGGIKYSCKTCNELASAQNGKCTIKSESCASDEIHVTVTGEKTAGVTGKPLGCVKRIPYCSKYNVNEQIDTNTNADPKTKQHLCYECEFDKAPDVEMKTCLTKSSWCALHKVHKISDKTGDKVYASCETCIQPGVAIQGLARDYQIFEQNVEGKTKVNVCLGKIEGCKDMKSDGCEKCDDGKTKLLADGSKASTGTRSERCVEHVPDCTAFDSSGNCIRCDKDKGPLVSVDDGRVLASDDTRVKETASKTICIGGIQADPGCEVYSLSSSTVTGCVICKDGMAYFNKKCHPKVDGCSIYDDNDMGKCLVCGKGKIPARDAQSKWHCLDSISGCSRHFEDVHEVDGSKHLACYSCEANQISCGGLHSQTSPEKNACPGYSGKSACAGRVNGCSEYGIGPSGIVECVKCKDEGFTVVHKADKGGKDIADGFEGECARDVAGCAFFVDALIAAGTGNKQKLCGVCLGGFESCGGKLGSGSDGGSGTRSEWMGGDKCANVELNYCVKKVEYCTKYQMPSASHSFSGRGYVAKPIPVCDSCLDEYALRSGECRKSIKGCEEDARDANGVVRCTTCQDGMFSCGGGVGGNRCAHFLSNICVGVIEGCKRYNYGSEERRSVVCVHCEEDYALGNGSCVPKIGK